METVVYDKLFKFRKLYDHVLHNCRKIDPEEINSIDEQIVPFKGKSSSMRQYNPKKPKKWGFKFLTRCSVKGLIYDFFLYIGAGSLDHFSAEYLKYMIPRPILTELEEYEPPVLSFEAAKIPFESNETNISLIADPISSLNDTMAVKNSVSEALNIIERCETKSSKLNSSNRGLNRQTLLSRFDLFNNDDSVSSEENVESDKELENNKILTKEVDIQFPIIESVPVQKSMSKIVIRKKNTQTKSSKETLSKSSTPIRISARKIQIENEKKNVASKNITSDVIPDTEPVSNKEKVLPASLITVLRLIENLPQNQNFKLFFDNWFTSPALLTQLLDLGMHCVCTIRTNRVDCVMPTSSALFEKHERGYFESFVHKEKSICLVRWLDNGAVHLMSTYTMIEPLQTIKRWNKQAKDRVSVPCPSIVKEYNKSMGGVDLCDMFHALYRIDRRSKRWYMRIVYFLLSVCVSNSWIIYKELNKDDKNLLCLREFTLSISDSLMNADKDNRQTIGRPKSIDQSMSINEKKSSNATRKYNRTKVATDIRFDNLGHWIIHEKKRQRCKFKDCQSLTFSKCCKCNIMLCFNAERNCFKSFHHE